MDGTELGSSDEELNTWLEIYDDIEKSMAYSYALAYQNVLDVMFNIPGKMGIIAKLWQLRPTMALYYGSFCNTFRYGRMNNVEATFCIYGIAIVIFVIILIMSYKKSQVESR